MLADQYDPLGPSRRVQATDAAREHSCPFRDERESGAPDGRCSPILGRVPTRVRVRRATSGVAAAAVLVAGLWVAPTANGASERASASATVTPASTLSSVDARIRSKLAERSRDPRLGTDLAMRVTDPGKKLALVSSQASEGQIPASNMKAVTAFVALKTLGPANRPVTRAVTDGALTRLTLVGGADPLLNDERLSALAFRTVQGLAALSPTGRPPTQIRVYFDDSLFAPHVAARGWRISYVPSQVNPVSALQRLRVTTTTPARDATTAFARSLTARGVRATVVTRSMAGSGASVASLTGLPVQAAIDRMLKTSDNDVAEMLARRSALAAGNSASWVGWRSAALRTLAAAGISTTGLAIEDGSGLSRSNRLTTTALASLMGRVATTVEPSLAGYLKALPLAGKDGTLAASNGRYNTSPTSCAVGRLSAKTGTLSGVIALSGVAIAKDGRPRAFSFVVNNAPSRYSNLEIRRAVDRLAATVVGCY